MNTDESLAGTIAGMIRNPKNAESLFRIRLTNPFKIADIHITSRDRCCVEPP